MASPLRTIILQTPLYIILEGLVAVSVACFQPFLFVLQAQMLTKSAALKRKDLGSVAHSRENSVPVMFFGTQEVAWVKDTDCVDFAAGVQKGFHEKKVAAIKLAIEQVQKRPLTS